MGKEAGPATFPNNGEDHDVLLFYKNSICLVKV